jgi:glycosyltransferase involved in cell wall biosynthesis
VRIAVYCPSFEDVSGVQEIVRRVSAHMIERGDVVAIVARARRDALTSVDAASGAVMLRVRLERAPYPARGLRAYRRFARRFPGGVVQLVHAVRGWEPDVIATFCSKFHAPYVLGLRVAVPAPIVINLQNAAVTADGPESPRLQWLLQRCASRVVTASEPVADYARRCLPDRADRVVVVPNAVDRELFEDAMPTRRARPYVLAVGRLAAQKGFDVLLDAVAAAGTSQELVVAGDGPDREALERRAVELGIAGRVSFLGSVDRPQVAGLMRGAAVVAIPSRFEGHPLVCLEAMAAGAPIVASDLPVLAGSVQHEKTALLVPVDDVTALAAAIRRLDADPVLAHRLADAALAAVRGFPTWADVATAMVDEFRHAIASRRKRGASPSRRDAEA